MMSSRSRSAAVRHGDTLRERRSRELLLARRQRLIEKDLERHGPCGIRALLDGLELDYAIDDVDGRLERLLDADPGAIALLAGAAR